MSLYDCKLIKNAAAGLQMLSYNDYEVWLFRKRLYQQIVKNVYDMNETSEMLLHPNYFKV